jgi:acyl-CoA thioesterase-2
MNPSMLGGSSAYRSLTCRAVAGRSFCTRRVTARQSVGVILEMTASYQVDEDAPEVRTAVMPDVPPPADLDSNGWSPIFERRNAPRTPGQASSWLKVADPVGDDAGLQAAGLAFLSDDLPTEAVVSLYPQWDLDRPVEGQFFSASLDHAIYFHRPMASDVWHLQTFTCHGLMSSRGVSVGYVFTEDGTHVATIVQEVLLRKVRSRKG